jgi:hypothetical protein
MVRRSDAGDGFLGFVALIFLVFGVLTFFGSLKPANVTEQQLGNIATAVWLVGSFLLFGLISVKRSLRK